MSRPRSRWIVVALLALPALVPAGAGAQDTSSAAATQQAYESRRAALVRELQQTQEQLAQIRSQRVSLQARIENYIAQAMAQRAQELLMSNEATALQQLDAMLSSAQDNLASQRDRVRALGDAVRRGTGAVIVVLLRADSTSQQQTLGALELYVDDAVAQTRTYSATANNALQVGAVDQLYRADVLPTAHSIRLQVAVNGTPLTQAVQVTTQSETVTYVQFAVRNGQLVPTTWTSKGTTPF
ncbi:MAG TPA: hypothetical protein VJ672_00040 [Gemmatimonadaceae bacterium]|nr:hypothetical protein [Gemmatimonadaceae bacterium]